MGITTVQPGRTPETVRARATRVAESFYRDIVNRISDGHLSPGDRLDTERELAEQLGICRVTVRKVLARLESEGFIERTQGRGAFVRRPLRGVSFDAEVLRGTLRLQTYWPTLQADNINRIVASFHAVFPQIRVEIVKSQTTYLVADVVKSCAEGVPPDIIHVPAWALPTLHAQVPIHDIEDLVAQDVLRDVYPKVKEALECDGHLMAYPFAFSPVMLAFNRSFFEAKGLPVPDSSWTWDRVAEMASAITTMKNAKGVSMAGFAFSWKPTRSGVFVAQGGGEAATDWRKTPAMTIQGVEEAMEFARTLSHVPGVVAERSDLADDLLRTGRTAMALCNYCQLSTLTSRRFEIDVAPIPDGPTRGTILFCSGFAKPKAPKRRDLARAFLHFVASAEAQAILRCSGAGIPPRSRIAEDSALRTNMIHPRGYMSFKDVLSRAYVYRRGLEPSHRVAINDVMLEFWLGLLEPGAMCAQVDRILESETNKATAQWA